MHSLLLVTILVSLCCEAFSITIPLVARQTRTLTSISHIVQRNHQQASGQRIPLRGNLTYWAEFHARVGLGTPPQNVYLQLDTGSSDLVVYGRNCHGCNGKDSYDRRASTSSRIVRCNNTKYYCAGADTPATCNGTKPCSWEDQYGDGSIIDGRLYEDILTLGASATKSLVSIGAIEAVNTDSFERFGVDGIWGVAYQTISGWAGVPAIDIYIKDFSLYNSFSMCLGNKPGGNGGVLALGDDFSKDSRFQWTNILSDPRYPKYGPLYYTVGMKDWFIGDTSLGLSPEVLNKGGVIVDSGTTLLIVPETVMDAIKSVFLGMCRSKRLPGICGVKRGESMFDGNCYKLSHTDIALFPKLALSFDGVSLLPIAPTDYLWEGAGEPGYFCLGIEAIDGDEIIIGDVFMQHYHTVFDRVQNKVGFGPLSSCPTI